MRSNVFSVSSVDEAFLQSAEHILKTGRRVSPRGSGTLEIPTSIVEIDDPTRCFITLKERKHPYVFMCMELIWMLSGDTDPWIIDYLPKWADFVDDVHGEKRLMGAYGPRIRHQFGFDQLRYVIDTLRKDPNSRQAIITISNPAVDHVRYRDFPCTQSFQFMIRDGKLEMTTVMRSNDLVLGACTDWFNFCSIQGILASLLEVELGQYRHVAQSLHIYDRDISKVEKILSNPERFDPGVPTLHGSTPYKSIEDVYLEASYGRTLKSEHRLPINGGYIASLLNFVSQRSSNAEKLATK